MRSLCFLCLVFPLVLTGQSAGWQGSTFEHEVTPSWGYALEVEHRADFGEFRFGEYLFTLNGDRLITEKFHLAFGGRLATDFRQAPLEGRLFADLYYDLPLGETALTLEGRLRFQRTGPFNGEEVIRNAVRPRFGVKWDIRDNLSAVAELEARFRYDDRKEWVRNRRTFGLIYDLSDRVDVEVFYRLQRDINAASADEQTNIFGVYLTYVLPDRRERDWNYRRPFGRRVF